MGLTDILQGLEDQKKRIEANLQKIQGKPATKTPEAIPTYQPAPEVQPKELRLTPKQKGLALMLSEGVTVKDAAKSLGMNEKYCYGLKKNLERYDLTSFKMLSLAHKAVKSIVQGLPVGESEAPKPSTILDAARMSMDRAFPLKTISESNNLHTFIEVKVDMERYKQGKPAEPTPSKTIESDKPYDV